MPQDGYFYPPTLLTGVAPASTAATVEIFGPVLASMTFRTPDEAIALANNTRYGLAASVWSENISTVLHVAERLKAGVVWINSTNLFDAAAPFGGYRESGYGREGGAAGLQEYLADRDPEARIAEIEGHGRSRRRGPLRASRRRRSAMRSTARRSSSSAAGRRARTAATAIWFATERSGSSARPGSATARTSATRSRRPRKASAWSGHVGPPARADPLLPGREPRRAGRRNSPHASTCRPATASGRRAARSKPPSGASSFMRPGQTSTTRASRRR